jgi:hypothetical protein
VKKNRDRLLAAHQAVHARTEASLPVPLPNVMWRTT